MKWFQGCYRAFPFVALLWIVVCLIVFMVAYTVFAQDAVRTATNCGNPNGLVVRETGRIINQGEAIEVLDEYVDEEGWSVVVVYDGGIHENDNDGLYICDKVSEE